MTNLDDRQKAFESKYAHDQEKLFKIEARTCKLFGLWVAEQMGLSADEATVFAGSVVSSNLDEPGFDDVKRTVKAALAEKGMEIADVTLDERLAHFLAQAQEQIESQ